MYEFIELKTNAITALYNLLSQMNVYHYLSITITVF